MNRYTVRFGSLLLVSSLLWACGPGSDPEDPNPNPDPGACGPFGCREPEPGFAKFTVGNADSVRWVGFHGCREIDLRTGKQPGNGLTKVAGQVSRSDNCDPQQEQGAYAFVAVLGESSGGTGGWTTAYQPRDEIAAKVLLQNCTWDTRPHVSAFIGQWWHVNKKYAENQLLTYFSPQSFASSLLPFDDDGIERLGEETIEGAHTIVFQNEQAKVWMVNGGERRHTPLRVQSDWHDVTFSEWDAGFDDDIPEGTRQLSEVCAVQ